MACRDGMPGNVGVPVPAASIGERVVGEEADWGREYHLNGEIFKCEFNDKLVGLRL